ncbi:MarR family winged helix-turn-helix transcriptional regulator [Actinophytocola gossypii]|uniref:MarR family transcriptional regulator n=1 Tax=Actinophytocola gossypii TaxID=2812003 RepID=A0ABT2JAZ5_9PSEU|nr:MarR family transcriptional regulator [Actinophytocola gossypii]MCT2584943.1 MarR family transcriptional regulator [Actinophytocola gossypii]
MGTSDDDEERAAAVQAVADAGRVLSTAAVLFHTNVSSSVGLGPTDGKVLELIRRYSDISAKELAERTGLAKNSISAVLSRLEKNGFVERRPDPADGRRLLLVSTAEGARRIGELFVGLTSRLDELRERYTTEQLRVIADYQLRAAAIQHSEAAKLGTPASS